VAGKPTDQFIVKDFFTILEVGETSISFTNSALFMVAAVILVIAFVLFGSRKKSIIPDKFQSLVELSYSMIAGMVRSSAGNEGMRFFPLVFSLFSFVLACNLLGMFPYFFTVTSHIIVTGLLALLVISTVIIYGFYKNGFGFLKLFAPSGLPLPMLILMVPIEIVSFLSRPLSLSIRLFANMLAGHITLKVFAGFIVLLASAGPLGIVGSVLPLAFTVAITALEFLVAFLQAYVFAILTCIYLNDALHPSH